jgi:hypothetical protein
MSLTAHPASSELVESAVLRAMHVPVTTLGRSEADPNATLR